MIRDRIRRHIYIGSMGLHSLYIRLSVGGKDNPQALYDHEPHFFVQRKHIEIFRGICAYEIAITGRYGGLYLDFFHKQSAHPGQLQAVLLIKTRVVKRAIQGLFHDAR
jgi:hypothetical protein